MISELDLILGRRLRQRRRMLRLSQQVVAERAGTTHQQIQKYECGVNRVSAARLWQIAEALGVPVGYFFDGLQAPRETVQ